MYPSESDEIVLVLNIKELLFVECLTGIRTTSLLGNYNMCEVELVPGLGVGRQRGREGERGRGERERGRERERERCGVMEKWGERERERERAGHGKM